MSRSGSQNFESDFSQAIGFVVYIFEIILLHHHRHPDNNKSTIVMVNLEKYHRMKLALPSLEVSGSKDNS